MYDFHFFDHIVRDLTIAAVVLIGVGFFLGWLVFA